jgi:poly(A) polymerase
MGRPTKDSPSPARARRTAVEIVRRLREAGHVAYLAGGCVRDELLGSPPVDYDVATDATPQRVCAMFDRTAEVGAAFGVVLVRRGPVTVEVATFRSEGPYSDRRRPDVVRFSDPESDARRRDYTINALFLDPLADPEPGPGGAPVQGHIVDYVGGLRDLADRVIRAVGDPDARLAEDHLRALRAVRLSARLGFRIDNPTAEAIRARASELAGVSPERVGDEVRRMMDHPSRADAAELIQTLGLDGPLLGRRHGPGETPVLRSLPAGASLATSLVAWGVDRGDIHPTGARADEARRRWRATLCLSNDERDDMALIGRGLGELEAWSTRPVAARKRAAAANWFPAALAVLAGVRPGDAAAIRRDVGALQATPSGLAPRPLITGDDLLSLGMTPGPRFGVILERVYEAQLEERVATREQALELARTLGV